LLTSFGPQPLALACVPGAERVSSRDRRERDSRDYARPTSAAAPRSDRAGARGTRFVSSLEPRVLACAKTANSLILSPARIFGNASWMTRESARASLPGARPRLVRARDADALVLGRRHKRPECVVLRPPSPSTRALRRARPFIASRPFSACPVSARPRDGRETARVGRGVERTRRSHGSRRDANRSKSSYRVSRLTQSPSPPQTLVHANVVVGIVGMTQKNKTTQRFGNPCAT
jgi:hypothetical protein